VSAFQRLRQIALAIILTWGWKRAVLAMAAGALSVLALAPFNAFPVLFITFPVMVWLIDGAGAGRYGGIPAAALTGYWFGLGYFVPGLYWIGYAFFVDADVFAWLTPCWACRPICPSSRRSVLRWHACSGPRTPRACLRSRQASPSPNGCAVTR
jgi:hypothetical protein